MFADGGPTVRQRWMNVLCFLGKAVNVVGPTIDTHSASQSQNAVTADLKNKKLLYFYFARQNRDAGI